MTKNCRLTISKKYFKKLIIIGKWIAFKETMFGDQKQRCPPEKFKDVPKKIRNLQRQNELQDFIPLVNIVIFTHKN